jgi:5-methyltetrahydrofolate--homocysteine methyltransferase
MNEIIQSLYDAVLEGDVETAKAKTHEALAAELATDEIVNAGLVSALIEVGRLFEAGEYYVPEMLISAKTMQACMDILKPYLLNSNVKALGKVVIGTVHGDLHDIGKNLVSMMLEGSGFEVKDLGIDVDAEKFIAYIQAEKPQVLALSAMLTTTMLSMKPVIDALHQAGLRNSVKVIVGGAPITQQFADSIGADGYAADASQAAGLARRLLSAN